MLSKVLNAVLLPLRIVFSHEFVNKLGLRSLRDERCDKVMKQCRGRLLDIGCGNNQLVRKYGHDSIGVDVHDFGGDAVIIEDSSKLPFDDGAFDTVSFVASLNHIPNRREVLTETHRILSEHGRIVLTMISPFIGTIRHKLAWWDKDQCERELKEGEEFSLSHEYIVSLLENEGFQFAKRKRIMCCLNNIYVFEKRHG
ncbi:MAG: class I SAM-dependent methyltransferase [Planctomycetota bacterium]|jgi:SAM-dependent methyltransferase